MGPEARAQKGITHWVSVQIARATTRLTELIFGISPDGYPLEVAIESCAKLIRLAEQDVKIVSNDLDSALYRSPPVLRALRQIVEWRRVRLSILHGPEADQRSIREIANLDGEVIFSKYPFSVHPDFMVVDNRHIRVGLPAIVDQISMRDAPESAFSMRDAPESAAKLEKSFEQLLHTPGVVLA